MWESISLARMNTHHKKYGQGAQHSSDTPEFCFFVICKVFMSSWFPYDLNLIKLNIRNITVGLMAFLLCLYTLCG